MTSLHFIVESGTDVRLVEGLASRFDLSILARRIEGGVEISHPPAKPAQITIGPASRLKFAWLVWRHLRAHRQQIDRVIAQGYGLAALAANLAGRVNRIPTAMLVCSPVESLLPMSQSARRQGQAIFEARAICFTGAGPDQCVGRATIHVLSQHLAHVVRRHGSRAQIDLICYGIDTSIFTPRQNRRRPSKRGWVCRRRRDNFFSSRVAPEKDSETYWRLSEPC